MSQERSSNEVVTAPPIKVSESQSTSATITNSPLLSEDWLAVWIGSILIVAILILGPALSAIGLKLPSYGWASAEDLTGKVFAPGNLLLILEVGILFYALAALAVWVLGGKVRNFLIGFPVVYLLAVAALTIAGNSTLNRFGVEYVIWALLFGLIIGNLIELPPWLKEASRSEFYIKTGLVILGVSVLFTDIIKLGLPGILQALIVVTVVWFFAYWLARKLGVDAEFAAILSTGVAICGVSAAIAAAGAVKGDRKKLSYTTTIVVLVAVPMLLFMPYLINVLGLDEIVGGAWLGGTLDTSASVVAASQIVGEVATTTGTVVKAAQNVLLGLAAFFIAAWWTVREKPEGAERPSPRVIWDRFPKFVLGFIAASLVFSFLIPAETRSAATPLLNGLRTLWFALAFVSIGLEARFANLVQLNGGRPAFAFLGAQAFNIIFTLIIAYLLFGGVLLPVPNIK